MIERLEEDAAPRVDSYRAWRDSQGVPVIQGFHIPNIKTVELAPWDWMGGSGAIVNLEGAGGTNDAYICELPPGGKSKPQKHLYEAMVYVATGNGATTVWQKGGRKHTFEWQRGSLFAIPLNAWYQHFNGSGREPARYLAVTNAPFIMNLYHNVDFVFGDDFTFTDRFDPEDHGYFGGGGTLYGQRLMSTNFVRDTHSLALGEQSERGPGAKNMKFDLAGQIMAAHISQFPVGTYKKAHFHGPGANVLILTGRGYSLLWPQRSDERTRIDWGPGSLFVPPQLWFHQHFNVSAEPTRYLALRWNNWRYPFVKMVEGSRRKSVKEGGTQLEYEDEDPEIHRLFEREVARAGSSCRMRGRHPFCTQ